MPHDSNQTRSVPEDTGTFPPLLECLFLSGCTHLFHPSDFTSSFCEVLFKSHLLCGPFPKYQWPQAIPPISVPCGPGWPYGTFPAGTGTVHGCFRLIWPASSLLLGSILYFAVFPGLGTGYNHACSVMFALVKDERSAALSSVLYACSRGPRLLEGAGGTRESREKKARGPLSLSLLY